MDYSNRFRSLGDASMRHRGTYIALRVAHGLLKPYKILDLTGNARDPSLHLGPVGSGEPITVSMSDSRVVMERPEIGMANVLCNSTRKGVALWHEAIARRQVKRSLDFSLITPKFIGKAEASRMFRLSVDSSSTTSRGKILDAFYNDRYPSYTECVEAVNTGRCISMAFSKRFALCIHPRCGIVIYYKNIIVGYVTEGTAVLLDQFNYLTESLEESSYAFE